MEDEKRHERISAILLHITLTPAMTVQWWITLQMMARNFLPRCTAFKSRICKISIKKCNYPGKKFLAVTFSVIVVS